jgi:hypothetical protein
VPAKRSVPLTARRPSAELSRERGSPSGAPRFIPPLPLPVGRQPLPPITGIINSMELLVGLLGGLLGLPLPFLLLFIVWWYLGRVKRMLDRLEGQQQDRRLLRR